VITISSPVTASTGALTTICEGAVRCIEVAHQPVMFPDPMTPNGDTGVL
jgi:hypothetical protein